jgi:hypothetical protein
MILTAGLGSGACRRSPGTDANPNNKGTGNLTGRETQPQTNTNSPDVVKEDKDGTVVGAVEDAMILAVERDVSLKRKGADEFVRILRNVQFHSGDELQVGDNSTARVLCSDSICLLSKGLYKECCTTGCESAIRLKPPAETNQNRALMSKSSLPPGEVQTFEKEETEIRKLEVGDVTKQFLIANLYSSWKLVEAKDELNNLSLKLKEPKAEQELHNLYPTVVRKTGDLYLKIDQKPQAELNYRKALELAPQSNDVHEKAATHVALGQLYEKSGMKDKAVENLQKGKELYVQEGNIKKAAEADRAIIKARTQ